MIEQKKFATIAVQSYEPEIKSGAGVVPGINLATTFKQKSPGCHYVNKSINERAMSILVQEIQQDKSLKRQ